MKKTLSIISVLLIVSLSFVYFISKSALPNWLGFYEVKRFEEKVIFAFQSTDLQKANYLELLLEKRLEELQKVVKNKNYEVYYKTSLRYGTQAGELTDLIVYKNLEEKRKTTMVLFKRHEQEIKKLLENRDNRDEWKFIQDDINYLTVNSAKLSQ